MTMLEFKRLASDEPMIPAAAMQDTRTIAINAPIEKVWRIQIDVEHWASWYSCLHNAKLSGPFGPGTELTYGGFSKHNLVIGKVKSQDLVVIYAGYRLIILLTGTIETLRRQTQERLDKSFVGLDSSGELTTVKMGRAIGVGIINPKNPAGVFTSRLRDFNKNLVESLGFRLDGFNVPILLVI